MKKIGLLFPVLGGVLLFASCCGAFSSRNTKYKKEMECAVRITDAHSIKVMKRGLFCCERLPKKIVSSAAARRFYLFKAWAYKPGSSEAPLEIARSYWDDENYLEALRYYDAARIRAEKPATAVIGEVTMYRLLRKFKPGMAWINWLRRSKCVDALQTANYLEARYLYDQGKYAKAEPLFIEAVKGSKEMGLSLGDTPFSMRDAWFYLAQIRMHRGDPQGAYKYFVIFLKKMADPNFQNYYAYWLPRLGSHQAEFLDKIESDWVHIRQ